MRCRPVLVPMNLSNKPFDALLFARKMADEFPIGVTLLNVVCLNIVAVETRVYGDVCFFVRVDCFPRNDSLIHLAGIGADPGGLHGRSIRPRVILDPFDSVTHAEGLGRRGLPRIGRCIFAWPRVMAAMQNRTRRAGSVLRRAWVFSMCVGPRFSGTGWIGSSVHSVLSTLIR
jgi:hypothetical protein